MSRGKFGLGNDNSLQHSGGENRALNSVFLEEPVAVLAVRHVAVQVHVYGVSARSHLLVHFKKLEDALI